MVCINDVYVMNYRRFIDDTDAPTKNVYLVQNRYEWEGEEWVVVYAIKFRTCEIPSITVESGKTKDILEVSTWSMASIKAGTIADWNDALDKAIVWYRNFNKRFNESICKSRDE